MTLKFNPCPDCGSIHTVKYYDRFLCKNCNYLFEAKDSSPINEEDLKDLYLEDSLCNGELGD